MVMAVLIVPVIFSVLNCFDVKEDYENNPQSASEKHGFESFEEWAEKKSVTSSCEYYPDSE